MAKPWNDPDATGIGWQVSLSEWPAHVAGGITYLESLRGSAFARAPRLFDELIEFARQHELSPDYKSWEESEGVALRRDHERMGRDIVVNLHTANGKAEITIRPYASWVMPAQNSTAIAIGRRWFTVRSDCDATLFRDTLELAYADVMRLTTDDLVG